MKTGTTTTTNKFIKLFQPLLVDDVIFRVIKTKTFSLMMMENFVIIFEEKFHDNLSRKKKILKH